MCMRVCSVAQSCLTLCDPVDCSPPGFSVHGILQAGILEWVPFSSAGDLPDPGVEPTSSALQAGSLLPESLGKPSEVQCEASLPCCVNLEWFTAGGRRGSVQAGVMAGKKGEVIKG